MPGFDQVAGDVVTELNTVELVVPSPEPCSTESEASVQLEVAEEASLTNSPDLETSEPKMLEENCIERNDSFLRDETPSVPHILPNEEIEMFAPENTDYVPQIDDMTCLNESSREVQDSVTCSHRQKTKTKRLGHPLIEVVQALFQGLSTAFVNSLNGVESFIVDQTMTTPVMLVITQPQRGSTGTCLPSQGEGVSQLI